VCSVGAPGEVGEEHAAVVEGGWVGQRWAGGDDVFVAGWNVGREKRDLSGGVLRRGSEATSFDGGEVFAEGVHGVNGEAGGDDGAVEGCEVIESDGGREGELDHGGGTAGDEEENYRSWGGAGEGIEDGVGGEEGVGSGRGVVAGEIEGAGCRGFAGECSWRGDNDGADRTEIAQRL